MARSAGRWNARCVIGGAARVPHDDGSTSRSFSWPCPGPLRLAKATVVNHDAFLAAVRDYARGLLTNYDIGTVLYRLTDHVTAVLGADGAGVSLAADRPDLAFVAATDGDIAAIEQEQVTAREALPPCLSHRGADRGRRPRAGGSVDGLPIDRARARARSVLAVPMPVAEDRIGALNIYRRSTHDWDDAEIEVGRVLADMASGYVLNAGQLNEARTLSQQLQHALDSRIIIEQAKGILAERKQITPRRGVRPDAQARPFHQHPRARHRRTDRRRHVSVRSEAGVDNSPDRIRRRGVALTRHGSVAGVGGP